MSAPETIFNLFRDFVMGINRVWAWLTTPWFTLNDFEFTPLAIFGVSGLLVILAFLLVHFLNPVN